MTWALCCALLVMINSSIEEKKIDFKGINCHLNENIDAP